MAAHGSTSVMPRRARIGSPSFVWQNGFQKHLTFVVRRVARHWQRGRD
jgi:hypothetical protein